MSDRPTEIPNDDAEDMFLSQGHDEYEEKKMCVRFVKQVLMRTSKKFDKKQIIKHFKMDQVE